MTRPTYRNTAAMTQHRALRPESFLMTQASSRQSNVSALRLLYADTTAQNNQVPSNLPTQESRELSNSPMSEEEIKNRLKDAPHRLRRLYEEGAARDKQAMLGSGPSAEELERILQIPFPRKMQPSRMISPEELAKKLGLKEPSEDLKLWAKKKAQQVEQDAIKKDQEQPLLPPAQPTATPAALEAKTKQAAYFVRITDPITTATELRVVETQDALVDLLKSLIGEPVQVEMFHGQQLFLSKGPVKHLMLPDGTNIPLESPLVLEIDEQGVMSGDMLSLDEFNREVLMISVSDTEEDAESSDKEDEDYSPPDWQ